MAEAVTKPSGMAGIEKRWFQEFAQVAKHGRTYVRQDYWNGAFVYAALKRSIVRWVIDPKDELHFFFGFLMEKLCRELTVYSRYRSEVVRRNQELNDVLAKLQSAEKKLSGKGIHFPESKAVLREIRRRLQIEIERLKRTKGTFWENSLHDYGDNIMLIPDGDTFKPIPTEDEQAYERLFESARYSDKLVRDVDLDRRFQIRLAIIFRHYLRREEGVSLSTVSKLVILFYICTDLASVMTGP